MRWAFRSGARRAPRTTVSEGRGARFGSGPSFLIGLAVVVVSLGGGCIRFASPPADPEVRTRNAAVLAREAGFERLALPVDASTALPVAVWWRPGSAPGCVRVYLEGDGLAWQHRRQPSADPTPVDPIGLRLAVADDSDATLFYLGRPCQYQSGQYRSSLYRTSRYPSDQHASGDSIEDPPTNEPHPGCRPILWTAGRYGDEVLASMDIALSRSLTVSETPVEVLALVGYSGGGVIAARLAARRDDVDRIVTVAAPLDVEGWTQATGVSPLVLSDSPMQDVDALRHLEQDHFIGTEDRSVPEATTLRFHEALGADAPSRVHRVEGLGHSGWPSVWEAALAEVPDLCGDPRSGSESFSVERIESPDIVDRVDTETR